MINASASGACNFLINRFDFFGLVYPEHYRDENIFSLKVPFVTSRRVLCQDNCAAHYEILSNSIVRIK